MFRSNLEEIKRDEDCKTLSGTVWSEKIENFMDFAEESNLAGSLLLYRVFKSEFDYLRKARKREHSFIRA